MRTLSAWLVHLYTAMGFVCAAGISVLIVGGGDASFRCAFFLMMIATAIDATDGWLARKADVKNVLPGWLKRCGQQCAQPWKQTVTGSAGVRALLWYDTPTSGSPSSSWSATLSVPPTRHPPRLRRAVRAR